MESPVPFPVAQALPERRDVEAGQEVVGHDTDVGANLPQQVNQGDALHRAERVIGDDHSSSRKRSVGRWAFAAPSVCGQRDVSGVPRLR